MEAAYGLSISITMFVTTILLSLYLYKIKNQKIMALIFFIVFGLEESLFLYANSLKFISGGYITVVIAILIFGIMFIWYRGVEIKERESQYLLVEKYKKQLLQLSSDKDIPKYATNLVYLTGAKYESDVDYAVLYSILNKQPKRANVYFFVHINVVDEPYKREYKVTKFSDKKIFKITFNLGFREHQRINMFMYQVIDDLLKNKELDLQPTKYNLRGKAESVGDFRFVLINEVLGNNNGLTSFDSFIMSLRLKLKRITVTPEKWFGLDTSIITKEAVPLNVIQIKEKIHTYLPQESIIGRIMDQGGKVTVVTSTEKNIYQHDIYSWQLIAKKFNKQKKPNQKSEIVYKSLRKYLQETEAKNRKKVVDLIFKIFLDSDFETFAEIGENKAENVIKIIGQVRELKKEDRDLIIKMLSELAKIYITTRKKNIRKIRK